jgi:hypothetical protein
MMRHRALTTIVIAVVAVITSAPLPAAEYNDDFATGIDSLHWTLVSNQPLFTVDDGDGNINFSKPVGGEGTGIDQIQLCSAHLPLGDFDVSVDFSDAELEFVNGNWNNFAGVELSFGGLYLDLLRVDGLNALGGDQVYVHTSPPNSTDSVHETATSGRLRVQRTGTTVSAYFDERLLHRADYNNAQVTRLCLSLGNDLTTDAVSVRFDNFTIVADDFSPAREIATFVPSTSQNSDAFGNPMAISGDTLAVAAQWSDEEWRSDVRGTSGAVYVYQRAEEERTGWTESQVLGLDTGADILRYGLSLAVDDDILAAGTIFACNDRSPSDEVCTAGLVHVYQDEAGSWRLVAEHIGDGTDDWLGSSLSLSQDTLAAGALNEGQQGRVHLYERDQGGRDRWGQVAVIAASDGEHGDQFGQSVSLSGDTLAVGAPGVDHGCEPSGQDCNSGAVYIFQRDLDAPGTWTQVIELTVDHDSPDAYFGTALSLDGDTLIIGAPRWESDYSSVYLFERDQGGPDNWGPVKHLGGLGFGAWNVALSGDTALIGGDPTTILSRSQGGADNWGEVARLAPRDEAVLFGQDAYSWDGRSPFAIDGDRYIVGASGAGCGCEVPGEAYVFDFHRADLETLALPAVARVQGAGAFFTSKWILFNSSDENLDVDLTYTPRADFGGDPQTVQHTIPAGGLQEITDPLLEIFGISDDAVGSVILRGPEGGSINDLMVQSVVFARRDDGREFGQFFPARRLSEALQEGARAFLATTEDPTRNRVNFGVMATRDGTSVRVSPVAPIGDVLSWSKRFNLDALQSRQLNDIHDAFDLDAMADVLLQVEVLEGAALVYGSVVDGKGDYAGTSDPTTVQPVTCGAFEVTLLELGPVTGYDEFSGSAGITNHSPTPAEVTVDFIDRSSPGIAASQSLTIAGGETLGYGDLVGDLIGMENAVGTVILSSDNGTLLSATGREFAIFRDGEDDVSGTAGQLIEGLNADDLLQPDKTHHFIGLRQLDTGDSLERSHIAFFNPGDSRVDVTMKLYDDAGEFEGSWTRGVRPLELVHVNNIISKINPPQDGGVKRLEVTTTGPVHARAFRVNPTGDPITIEPFRR